MKLENLVTRKLTVLFFASLFLLTACNNKQKSTDNKAAENTQKKIEAPKMDLHAATFMGNLKAVKQHILIGSDLNIAEPLGGSSPLISASLFGKTKIAVALINAGANLNFTNKEGSTALHTAAFFCKTEIVKALLEKGADKSIRNNSGATAYESVAAPFKSVKGIYEFFENELGPLGLKLDYEKIEKTRPEIAKMLE